MDTEPSSRSSSPVSSHSGTSSVPSMRTRGGPPIIQFDGLHVNSPSTSAQPQVRVVTVNRRSYAIQASPVPSPLTGAAPTAASPSPSPAHSVSTSPTPTFRPQSPPYSNHYQLGFLSPHPEPVDHDRDRFMRNIMADPGFSLSAARSPFQTARSVLQDREADSLEMFHVPSLDVDGPTWQRDVRPGEARIAEAGVIVGGRVVPRFPPPPPPPTQNPSRRETDDEDEDLDEIRVNASPSPFEVPMKRGPKVVPALANPHLMATIRLRKEMKALNRGEVCRGCHVAPSDSNWFQWTAAIEGPPGTPYHGGLFFFLIECSDDYPKVAPRVACQTTMFHSMLDPSGIVSTPYLTNWSQDHDIAGLLRDLVKIMSEPDLGTKAMRAQNPDYTESWNRTATVWTREHAAMRIEERSLDRLI